MDHKLWDVTTGLGQPATTNHERQTMDHKMQLNNLLTTKPRTTRTRNYGLKAFGLQAAVFRPQTTYNEKKTTDYKPELRLQTNPCAQSMKTHIHVRD